MRTKHISWYKSRQRIKLICFFPTFILNRSISPSDTVRNLGVTFDSHFIFRKHVSLTCRSCFYHIRELRRIRRYISLSVAKTIPTALITSRLDYCNFLLYNIASKDVLKLQCDQNCLGLSYGLLGFPILTPSWNFFIGSLFNRASFVPLYNCLWNSFFKRTFVSIFHGFSSIQAQRDPFIWLSLVCYQR